MAAIGGYGGYGVRLSRYGYGGYGYGYGYPAYGYGYPATATAIRLRLRLSGLWRLWIGYGYPATAAATAATATATAIAAAIRPPAPWSAALPAPRSAAQSPATDGHRHNTGDGVAIGGVLGAVARRSGCFQQLLSQLAQANERGLGTAGAPLTFFAH